ncbi:MAG: 4a-hydroxytetrahydrobiopterin dehydratase [Proteobacteria bacterium]|nr:4a-hydroxytetrahydrobiopterin dehydratase [Pseudomonadota bacterium]
MNPDFLNPLANESCSSNPENLTQKEIEALAASIPGWGLDNQAVSKTFSFKGFSQVMGFVNAIAWIAQRQNHHPEITFGYNTVQVKLFTHSKKGLTRNDFICASKIDHLLDNQARS